MASAVVEKLKKDFNNKFGDDVIFSASHPKFKLKRIPTGCMSIDILLGGGVPLGRWVEIYGDESVLKTTLALMAVANAQRMGFPCIYVDSEKTITKEFLEHRDVDTSPDMLLIIRTETGEQVVDILKDFIKAGEHKIIVVDSLASMLPQREANMELTKEAVGAQGLMTSRMTRILTAVNKTDVCIILINQTRQKIVTYGDPTTTPGGKAPKFYAGQRLRLIASSIARGSEKVRGRRKIISREIIAILEKDKTGKNYGREAVIHYNVEKHIIDDAQELLAAGQLCGIIKRKKLTYYIGSKGFSKANILTLLGDEKKTRKLKAKILEASLAKE